jgi:Tfp pilus assembly protein PilO
MPEMKPDIDGKRLFLAIILTLGGVITILVPASKLDGRSIVGILSGVTFVVLGYSFLWESMEGLRERKKAKQEAKDTKQ